VIDLVVEHAENGNWPEFDAAIELLRAQRQQGAEPDGELCDCTHTVNHCTDADNCRVVKKLVAYGKATHGLADTKATPPQANALVAAAYMKAAALLRERISPNDAMDEAEERLYDTLEKAAQIIEEAIPADAEAALRERDHAMCMRVAYAVRTRCDEVTVPQTDELEAIVNSVLGEGGK
jgi:hypothetical protein